MSGIPLSRLGLRALGFRVSWSQSPGQQVAGRPADRPAAEPASRPVVGQQVHGARGLVQGAWWQQDHRLHPAYDCMDVVSDSETVVLLSHRPVIFSTPVVQFVLAMRLVLWEYLVSALTPTVTEG